MCVSKYIYIIFYKNIIYDVSIIYISIDKIEINNKIFKI